MFQIADTGELCIEHPQKIVKKANNDVSIFEIAKG